jgi:hypothetical protein
VDLYLRVIFASLALCWVWQLIRTLQKPPDWELATPPGFPVRFSRTIWLAASVVGIVVAILLFFVTSNLLSRPS